MKSGTALGKVKGRARCLGRRMRATKQSKRGTKPVREMQPRVTLRSNQFQKAQGDFDSLFRFVDASRLHGEATGVVTHDDDR
jgi:hypothetical protein